MQQLQQTTDSTSPCTPSVTCDPNWDGINDAILDIYAINMNLGAMAVCTGKDHHLVCKMFAVLSALACNEICMAPMTVCTGKHSHALADLLQNLAVLKAYFAGHMVG
jgi:hypothetical protein